ncbi:uncharacterized protein LOC117415359 isoform X4 [Acipenser ruthenus]|uniref:uncharacterized protein LOC117415359 isoform X4 n=1 Tax=Acipenser ruthenus TaxID=7906 RepID=UPI002741FFF2|nr:uncharacterized protein LOC117415359 isoform X4 [Acipenser ruthenus]
MDRSVKMSAQRLRAPSSVFYKAVDGVEEIMSGYLVKSPPSGPFFYQKSWKRRFFVFCKTPDNVHLLKYCKDEDDRDKPLGGIDLSVQDVDKWFNAIFSVLMSISKAEPLRNTEQERQRSMSESNAKKAMNDLTKNSSIQEKGATCESFTADAKLRRQSLSESYYSVPKSRVDQLPKPEPTENHNMYMPMASVRLRIVEEALSDQNRVSTSPASGNIADVRNPHDFHLVKREVHVIQENPKNHLTLAETDRKPCVAHWLGPDDGCVFHKGDQIIAVNDLGTDSTMEIQTCLSKNNNEEIPRT